jgi:hypothetical protein
MTSPPAGYPYDTSIHFDWPATAPMAGQCRPGTYSGTFQCSVGMAMGLAPTFSGPVTFTLTESPSGEFLEISNGTLQATANGGITAKSDLSGRLDCNTNQFHANVENGTTSILFFGMFVGRLDGRLDRLTETLTGTWTLAADLGNFPNGIVPDSGAPPLFGCTGTWSVTRQ